ncbi:MAG: hypothetical protein AB4372_14780 [Xenococcus sp. (in: cyanobacteria)]
MKEFYGSATYYGIGQIIKTYADFPAFIPLPVSIQHGWINFACKHDARFDAAENWYWSNRIEQKYREKFAGLNTRVVGAPFLYLLKNLNYSELSPSQRKGSIVFPSHSATLIGMECDFDKYADMLDRLSDEYKPITVCIYYLDRDKGLDKPFLERGFEVVSNGPSVYETNFLKNYIINTQDKKYAFSNQMTSALLFASAMGLKSFFYGPSFITNSIEPNIEGMNYTEHHRQWESEYSKYFAFPNCNLEAQQKFAARELGRDTMLSPSEMRRLLWHLVFKKPYLIMGLKKLIKRWIIQHH